MLSKIQKAIISTLLYADVFEYPLNVGEIGKWLIQYHLKSQISNLKTTTQNLKILRYKKGFYFLRERDYIVKTRVKRKFWSENKMKELNKIIYLFKLIPSIKLVGVTGALAMNNAKKNDDIDLFIITQKGTLWTTRFFITLLLDILGKRRHPGEKNVNNKICLNMFTDEDHLGVEKKERDLFSAHEVVQMKPVYITGNTYSKFIEANQWVREYLPNSVNLKMKQLNNETIRNKSEWFHGFMVSWLNLLEWLLKKLQLLYMHNRRTTEKISEGIIRFHPKDARVWVMNEYNIRINKLFH